MRAVVGTPSPRCWVECAQVAPEQSSANVATCIAGAVIGGMLGHQVGDGRGQQQAAVGRDGQRCEGSPGQTRPDDRDVTYTFLGWVIACR